MKKVTGDIWDYHDRGYWIVIPTNGEVRANGKAVMGKGLALQASKRIPWLAERLGIRLKTMGNQLYVYSTVKIIAFPTKHNWRDPSDIDLIRKSAESMFRFFEHHADLENEPWAVIPKVGCGLGQLDWADVEPVLDQYLPDNVWVISQ